MRFFRLHDPMTILTWRVDGFIVHFKSPLHGNRWFRSLTPAYEFVNPDGTACDDVLEVEEPHL